ncbi:hypothetical protein GGF32_005585 [Allomyces javanicus]|nr:hypothetical protein GGF32_005585 [Allomyces javanicus]
MDAQADEMIALESTLVDLTSNVISTLDAPADANVQLYTAYEAARNALARHLSSLDSLAVSPDVYQALVGYDRDTQQAEFDQREFTCLICLSAHRGRADVVLPICDHVFCRSCSVPLFTMLIKEGMPMNVRCSHPHWRCGMGAAVMAIVQRHRHEHSIKALLKKLKAQRCPYWRQATIKDGGCNHMTCPTCCGHFCYLCGAGLNHMPNYYVHWSGWGENLCEGLWEKGRHGGGGGDEIDDDGESLE